MLDEYQLVYITQGGGYFESSSQKLTEVTAGSMFLLFPNEWHNYHPNPSSGWEEYWIGFKGPNIDNRIKNGFFSKQKPVFYVGVLDDIVQLYTEGMKVAQEQNSGYQQMMAGIVNHLLGIAYSRDKHLSFEDMKVANHINRAKIIFANSFQHNIKPEEVAEQIHMSYSWFRRLFKEFTGFAPAQYIQELRIQHSKELLTNTSFSIKEIAYKSGFDNPEYYCTAFKKRSGMTPLKYRNFTQGKISL